MIFRVRSAKAVKITDLDLMKRLGIIVSIFTVFLFIRTMVGPPPVIVARTADDLKAYICKTDWWDHVFTASKSCPVLLISNFLFKGLELSVSDIRMISKAELKSKLPRVKILKVGRKYPDAKVQMKWIFKIINKRNVKLHRRLE